MKVLFDSDKTKNRPLTILKLLWEKFHRQTLFWKILTVCCMLIFVLLSVLYFSAFIIWWVVKYLMVNIGLRILEWYLVSETNEIHTK